MKQVTKIVYKGCTKILQNKTQKVFHFTHTDVYNGSILLFHFFGIWLTVKYKNFLIINKILHIYLLLYKDKLNVQYESATCLLRTFMLHFCLEKSNTCKTSSKLNVAFHFYIFIIFLYVQEQSSNSFKVLEKVSLVLL